MRLCRYQQRDSNQVGLYDEKSIINLPAAVTAYAAATHDKLPIPVGDSLLELLPGGKHAEGAKKLADWAAKNDAMLPANARVETDKVQLLVPVPRPNKLLLLAGNYNSHIQEGGGAATERKETFPYVFMKPPSTTLTDPGKPVFVPKSSPKSVDWEIELAIVIGKGGKHISESTALAHVAGYTIVNDISDRKFRPNPERKERKNDSFFDWLHGKWHDSFCPMGPCIVSAADVPDPQQLKMKLTVNDKVWQDASTAQQIFPVAAVIEFISRIVTLEPGDVIATGTPAGVGNATGTYLHAGDQLEAWIEKIGTLKSPVKDEVA
jgi:2,4-diketo-3-deoxy-L-fuconate hydrolase